MREVANIRVTKLKIIHTEINVYSKYIFNFLIFNVKSEYMKSIVSIKTKLNAKFQKFLKIFSVGKINN